MTDIAKMTKLELIDAILDGIKELRTFGLPDDEPINNIREKLLTMTLKILRATVVDIDVALAIQHIKDINGTIMDETTRHFCPMCGVTEKEPDGEVPIQTVLCGPCKQVKDFTYSKINKLVSFWTKEYLLQILEVDKDDFYKVLRERYILMEHGD